MVYCLRSPECIKRQNPEGNVFCQYCGSSLLFRGHFRVIESLRTALYFETFLAQDVDFLLKPHVVRLFYYDNPCERGMQTKTTLEEQQFFRTEIQQIDRIARSDISRIVAYFDVGDCFCMIREFVDGQTLLAEHEQQGPFDEDKIRKVLLELLPILRYLHRQGIVHNAIKPSNIIRRKTGELVAVDLGAAQLTETVRYAHSLNTGIILYSAYTAPERYSGRPCTPAVDLFALGVTCVALLAEAFDPYNDFTILSRREPGEWQGLVQLPLSSQIISVINKLVDKDMRSRYSSADEVLQALS